MVNEKFFCSRTRKILFRDHKINSMASLKKRGNTRCDLCHQSYEGSSVHRIKDPSVTPLFRHTVDRATLAKVSKLRSFKYCCRHLVEKHPRRIKPEGLAAWVQQNKIGELSLCSCSQSSNDGVEEDAMPPLTKRSRSRLDLPQRDRTDAWQLLESTTGNPELCMNVSKQILLNTPVDDLSGHEAMLLNLIAEQCRLFQVSHSNAEQLSAQTIRRVNEEASQRLDAMTAQHLDELRQKRGYSLDAIVDRKELKFWTGFVQKSDMFKLLASAQQGKCARKRGASSRSKKGVELIDRVTWIMMMLWRDLSFYEVYQLLIGSGDWKGSYSGLRRLLKRTAKYIATAGYDTIKMPATYDEWKSRNKGIGSSNYDNETLCLVIDGTSCPIYNPHDHSFARLMFVHYKGHKAYRYFILTTLDGYIVYLSRMVPGVTTDSAHYAGEGRLHKELIDLAERILPLLPAGMTIALMGDKGYVDIIQPPGWLKILTKSAAAEASNPSNQTQIPAPRSRRRTSLIQAVEPRPILGTHPAPIIPTQEQKDTAKAATILDTACVQPRTVVEQSFGVVKRYRKLSSGHIRVHDSDTFLYHLIVIATVTANFIISGEINVKGSDGLQMDAEGASAASSE